MDTAHLPFRGEFARGAPALAHRSHVLAASRIPARVPMRPLWARSAMICPTCAAAGDLATDPAPLFDATLTLIAEWHSQCTGHGRCTCQHRVPTVEQLRERRDRPGAVRGLAGIVQRL